jgi:hypothetical protein
MLPAAGNDAQSALLLPESNSIQRVFSKGTASVAKVIPRFMVTAGIFSKIIF